MTASAISLVVLLGLFGVVVGPWLGILADRAPERSRPRIEHRCPRCRHGWGHRSLVPLIDWRGQCGNCGGSKGLRYLLVDVASMASFMAVGWRFGADWRLVPYLMLAAVLVVLSVIDLETHLLPNVIVGPAIASGLFGVLVLSGELDYQEGIFPALLGATVFGALTGLVHVVHEPGMGFGDVKLSLLLGLFVGWLHPELLVAVRLGARHIAHRLGWRGRRGIGGECDPSPQGSRDPLRPCVGHGHSGGDRGLAGARGHLTRTTACLAGMVSVLARATTAFCGQHHAS